MPARSICFPYELITILLKGEKYSTRHLAAELGVDKDTIHRHVRVMSSLGLVQIQGGRGGGIKWIVNTNIT